MQGGVVLQQHAARRRFADFKLVFTEQPNLEQRCQMEQIFKFKRIYSCLKKNQVVQTLTAQLVAG